MFHVVCRPQWACGNLFSVGFAHPQFCIMCNPWKRQLLLGSDFSAGLVNVSLTSFFDCVGLIWLSKPCTPKILLLGLSVMAFDGQLRCFLIPEGRHKFPSFYCLAHLSVCLYGVQFHYVKHYFSPICCLHSQQRKKTCQGNSKIEGEWGGEETVVAGLKVLLGV